MIEELLVGIGVIGIILFILVLVLLPFICTIVLGTYLATLLASYKEYQNFFAYNIYFTSIPTTDDNDINKTDNIINETDDTETIAKENNNTEYMDLEKYKTGNNIIILFIIFICVIILTKNR